ncbi:MAG: GNAT family N-acetyltransferase [Phycisphaerae bacterium]
MPAERDNSDHAVTIRPRRTDDGDAAERILRAVPDWFGIEDSLIQYARDVERFPTWIADAAGRAIGFVTLHRHFEHAAEIHCIAVVRSEHRRGVGAALIARAEAECRAWGVRFLQVKTLGPSRPCEFYDRTRAFYLAQGFTALEEFPTLWPGNPCLQLVKRL